jgi:hypothetical protein
VLILSLIPSRLLSEKQWDRRGSAAVAGFAGSKGRSSSSGDTTDEADGSELKAQRAMNRNLWRIEAVLERVERLADELHADPDGHVRRSANELRAAFDERRAIEPAVARVRDSILMLRRGNQDGTRREFQRRANGVDHLEHVLQHELLPHLRRVGFDV